MALDPKNPFADVPDDDDNNDPFGDVEAAPISGHELRMSVDPSYRKRALKASAAAARSLQEDYEREHASTANSIAAGLMGAADNAAMGLAAKVKGVQDANAAGAGAILGALSVGHLPDWDELTSTVKDAYQHGKAQQQEATDMAQDLDPSAYGYGDAGATALQAGLGAWKGGVNPLAAGGKVAAAKALAKAGALAGAASGIAQGDGVADSLGKAATGGAIGAVSGAAVPVLGSVLEQLAPNLARLPVSKALPSAFRGAARADASRAGAAGLDVAAKALKKAPAAAGAALGGKIAGPPGAAAGAFIGDNLGSDAASAAASKLAAKAQLMRGGSLARAMDILGLAEDIGPQNLAPSGLELKTRPVKAPNVDEQLAALKARAEAEAQAGNPFATVNAESPEDAAARLGRQPAPFDPFKDKLADDAIPFDQWPDWLKPLNPGPKVLDAPAGSLSPSAPPSSGTNPGRVRRPAPKAPPVPPDDVELDVQPDADAEVSRFSRAVAPLSTVAASQDMPLDVMRAASIGSARAPRAASAPPTAAELRASALAEPLEDIPAAVMRAEVPKAAVFARPPKITGSGEQLASTVRNLPEKQRLPFLKRIRDDLGEATARKVAKAAGVSLALGFDSL